MKHEVFFSDKELLYLRIFCHYDDEEFGSWIFEYMRESNKNGWYSTLNLAPNYLLIKNIPLSNLSDYQQKLVKNKLDWESVPHARKELRMVV